MNSVEKHELSPSVLSAVRRCGFSATSDKPIYGVSVGGGWNPSTDLAKVIYDTESDFFASAEVWTIDGKAKVIIFWSLSLDIGSEVRAIACLNDRGRAVKMQVSNWRCELESGKQQWLHQTYETLDGAAKIVSRSSHFEDARGNRIAKPTLPQDIQGDFDWVPELAVFREIEADLLVKH